jgi:Domain of unknown function (DUF2703)
MTAPATTMATRTLQIEFLFLDLDTCTRCRATDATLLEAIDRTHPALEAAGGISDYEPSGHCEDDPTGQGMPRCRSACD